MSQVRIDDLQAGMQLAENVHLPNGRLLLYAGITLNSKHLLILRTWGVATVKLAKFNEKMPEAA